MKVWHVARTTKIWHGDRKWAQVVGEKAGKLAQGSVATNFQFVKKKKNAVKWSAIKWFLPVLHSLSGVFSEWQ